ncbi:MAG: hypothetical protein OHK0053_26150 [Microscillaceae bacterium]
MKSENTLQSPFLQMLDTQLGEVMAQVAQQFEGLSVEQFNWKPSPQSWSIAECMQHLLVVYSHYQPQLPQQITPHALKNTDNEAPRSRFMGRLFKRFVNPDKFRKVPALKSLQPARSEYPLSLRERYLDYLAEVRTFMQKADALQLHLNKIKIHSSVSKLIRFNLGDYFEVETMHNRRHLAQMKRVMEQTGFPH